MAHNKPKNKNGHPVGSVPAHKILARLEPHRVIHRIRSNRTNRTKMQVALDNGRIGTVSTHGRNLMRMRSPSVCCSQCGLRGTFFGVTKSNPKRDLLMLSLFGVDKDGVAYPFTVDHVIPRSKGGPNTLSNLVVMCRHCNWVKADKITVRQRLVLAKHAANKAFSKWWLTFAKFARKFKSNSEKSAALLPQHANNKNNKTQPANTKR